MNVKLNIFATAFKYKQSHEEKIKRPSHCKFNPRDASKSNLKYAYLIREQKSAYLFRYQLPNLLLDHQSASVLQKEKKKITINSETIASPKYIDVT